MAEIIHAGAGAGRNINGAIIQIKMKKWILIIVGLIIALCLGTFFYTWYQLHTSIVLHVRPGKNTPSQFNLTAKFYQITSQDGVKLGIWHIPVKNPKAAVILVHGYSDSDGGKSEMLGQAKFLNNALYATFLVDLRSYGESEGGKTYLGVKEWQDVAAVYDFAKALPENKNKKVGILGDSMGAAIAIITAGKIGKGDFVIAEVPFANYKTVFHQQFIRKKYPSILVSILLPFLRLAAIVELGFNYESYSPDRYVSRINVPIFVMSAERDDWVGRDAGKSLFDLAKQPKEFWHANTSHEIFVEEEEELKSKTLNFLSNYAL